MNRQRIDDVGAVGCDDDLSALRLHLEHLDERPKRTQVNRYLWLLDDKQASSRLLQGGQKNREGTKRAVRHLLRVELSYPAVRLLLEPQCLSVSQTRQFYRRDARYDRSQLVHEYAALSGVQVLVDRDHVRTVSLELPR